MASITDMATDTSDTLIIDHGEESDNGVEVLINEIIKAFDDFLWCHSVDMHNTEPKVDDWGDQSIIYGSQLNELESILIDIFQEWSLI